MPQIKWIKMSTDMFSNRKMKQLEKCENGNEITLIWVKLLCLAGTVNDGGMVYIAEGVPYTPESLATEFGTSPEITEKAISMFEKFGMTDRNNQFGYIQISDWESHQNSDALDKMRDKHRVSQAKYREKQKVTSPVTSRDGADKEKEKEKEKDKEKDKDRSADSASGKDFAEHESNCALSADGCGAAYAENGSLNAKKLPYTEKFESFWKNYPVKAHKRKCFEIWLKENLEEFSEKILEALSVQKTSVNWKKEDGRYIPNPQTYLENGMWEDLSVQPEPVKISEKLAYFMRLTASDG